MHLAVAGEALSYAAALGLDPRSRVRDGPEGRRKLLYAKPRERMLSGEFTLTESALSILLQGYGSCLKAAEAQGFGASSCWLISYIKRHPSPGSVATKMPE